MISAKVICDSLTNSGHSHRLTTMELVFHRFILAEFNTHRQFSRNSASSRAIPTAKIIDKMNIELALPIHFGANQSGMSAHEELSMTHILHCTQEIRTLSKHAVSCVKELSKRNLHKQTSNRYLEPWMWHTVIVSATNYDNFFHQRCSPQAQPEMKALAEAMYVAYSNSTPRKMQYNDWHLPYVSQHDYDEIASIYQSADDVLEVAKMISVARCARVSYLNHDGSRDIQKDVELYDRLKSSGHWSPFEHVAKPCIHFNSIDNLSKLNENSCIEIRCNLWGNFVGWDQFRRHFPNQCINQYRRTQNTNEVLNVQV